MKLTRIILRIFAHYLMVIIVQAFPSRIPLGGVFDNNSLQAEAAFRYAVEKHNNSTSVIFKLSNYPKIIDVSDSYELSKAICAIMSRGVFSLFGVTNRSSISTIESVGRVFKMPYVTPSSHKRNSNGAAGFLLHMRPKYDKAIVDIITHYKWPRVFYVYDTDEGVSRLQQLYRDINREAPRIEIQAMRIINTEECYALLRLLDTRAGPGDKYIVMDLATEKAYQSVLRQIQNVGMNRDNYHYLLGGLVMDELDLNNFKHGGVNITGFRLVDPTQKKVKSIQSQWARLNPKVRKGAGADKKIKLDAALIMDGVAATVKGLEAILHRDPEYFRHMFRRGDMFNNDSIGIKCKRKPIVPLVVGETIADYVKNVTFEGITGWVAFDQDGFRKDYVLNILELGLDSEPTIIGVWNYSSGLTIRRHRKTEDVKKTNVANQTKIVTTILSQPYLMLRKQPEDGKPLLLNDRYEGYCADLAKKVAEIVNIDYLLQPVNDGKYGAKQTDGTWNGMVGELTKRNAHLAIAPLTISSVRERVIDFSKPFMSLGISIMIKKPEKQKPGVFSFMDPLSYEIWMCIIFAYIGVSVVLFLVSRFSPYEWQIEDSINGPTFTNDFTILNSLWFSLGAFMQQGCDISPRSISGRIVGSVWWFFTLIIISSYTANLAAFLTVERMLTPIESADDLAKQTEIQYGTLEAGSTKEFFSTSKIAVYERMWAFMSSAKPNVFVDSTEDGVRKVRNMKGKYAFLLESTMNDYYNQRKPCNTMRVGGNLDSKGYGIATPLGSEIREMISLAVLQLRETGELQKLHKKWWYDKGECAAEAESKGSSQSALTLSNVAGIFYILIGGLGLSMVISLLEFLYKSRVESRREKSFASSMRSKARMSMPGIQERENGGVGSTDFDVNKSLCTVPIARSSAVSLV